MNVSKFSNELNKNKKNERSNHTVVSCKLMRLKVAVVLVWMTHQRKWYIMAVILNRVCEWFICVTIDELADIELFEFWFEASLLFQSINE